MFLTSRCPRGATSGPAVLVAAAGLCCDTAGWLDAAPASAASQRDAKKNLATLRPGRGSVRCEYVMAVLQVLSLLVEKFRHERRPDRDGVGRTDKEMPVI